MTYQEWKGKYVDKSGESGIIKARDVKRVTINSIEKPIEQPIEQRQTGKGNPNAILTFGIELNNRQRELLSHLPEYDSRISIEKSSVNMSDLSALTAYTGDEFAMFTKGQNRLIIRGGVDNVNIDAKAAESLAKEGYRWSGHTHPGDSFNCIFPSDGDKLVLKQFKQNTSVIYNSKGQFSTFGKE
ncbi:MAG: hypothetical protein IJU56_00075 [Clostridia bacterium]|nr:hypothetical protein [Clostridia bacterium]